MWFITNNKTGYIYYLVGQPTGHTVGRAKTDLVIQDDESISRQHAMLVPDNDVLKLTDTGSRYGTYVNGDIAKIVCIRKDHPTELRVADKVQFGRCGSLWTVGKMEFRCLTSTLMISDKLKTTLDKIGVELLPGYTDNVTCLIMPTITVTTKLLLSLVGQVPVVSPDYFTAVEGSIAQGIALPPAADFIPACTERDIKNDPSTFKANPTRRNLFLGKEFIFLNTNQCRHYEAIIKLAGGVCRCAQREKIAKSHFVKPNIITIKLKDYASSQSQSQSLDSLDKQFTAQGLRMIPEVEIGLAILYCSTEKYCNPSYNFASNVEVCREREPDATENILAKNSMNSENCSTKIKTEHNTIPETEPNTTDTSGTVGNASNTSLSVAPRATPTTEPPSSLRRSKRFPEEADSFQEPKRPRRATAESSSSKTILPSQSNEQVAKDGAVTNNTNTPLVNSIPAVAVPSQVISSSVVPSVNQKAPNSTERNTATPTVRAATRRRANLLQTNDDDDLFNLEGNAPRKKPRTAGPSAVNGKSSINSVNENGTSRTEKITNVDEDDLFAAVENLPPARQRGPYRRNAHTASLQQSTAAAATGDNLSKDTADTSCTSQKNKTLSNSVNKHYLKFMKPIEPSTCGWLSSSMVGLKLESNDDDLCTSMNLKQEQLCDTVDGSEVREDKRWIAGMSNIFQVEEKSMKLVVWPPPSLEESERSGSVVDGVRNFKAFAKKRNFQPQQTSVPLKLVCALDESQAS